jgi:hypothetical protein
MPFSGIAVLVPEERKVYKNYSVVYSVKIVVIWLHCPHTLT